MRTAVVFTAALAAAVMASPLIARDEVIVTATDVAYVTDIVTVTAGQEPTAASIQAAAVTTPAAAPAAAKPKGHKYHKKPKPSQTPAPSSAPAPAPSSEAPAPVAPSSSAAPAPAPAPSSYAPAPAPAPTTSAAPAPAPSAPATGQTGVSYKADAVSFHNVHRANYSSPDLVWDQALADAAAVNAKGCHWGHDSGDNGLTYGQNIAVGAAASQISDIVGGQFYNGEVNAYNNAISGGSGEPDMTTFDSWGHMSQVVWAGTQKVGCYTFDCTAVAAANGGVLPGLTPPTDPNVKIPAVYTVCNYNPPGNVAGQYRANIGACKDSPTVNGVQDATYGTDS